MGFLGIGHVHLKVSDIKKAQDFYAKMLGFKITEHVGNYTFLTFGKRHHDLALQEVKNAKKTAENSIGLYHFAIEAKNMKELAGLYFKLKNNGIEASLIDHGISKTIYFSDPDGNGIEVYVDTTQLRKKWQGFSSIIPEEVLKKQLKTNDINNSIKLKI